MPPRRRVIAPVLPPEGKVQGPQSYFPGIEKRCGRPVQEWLDLVVERIEGSRHGEVVEWLKAEHGLGHGHANALVAYVRAKLSEG